MKILLTGASGLLGSHLLQLGLQKNYEFTCIGRKISKRSYLHTVQDKVEFISMDLTNESEILSLKTDFDVVIHSAAMASPFAKDQDMMDKLNVEATKNLYLHLGDQAKWVQVSSVATMSNGDGQKVDENFFGKCRDTYYAKTKVLSDKFLEDQKNSKILFIHPCYMIGAWDSRPSSGAVFLGLKLKRFKYYLKGMKNFVAAADVAKGIFQALEKETSGRFLLGNENINVEKFMEISCEKLYLDELPNPLEKEFLEKSSEFSSEQKAFIKEFCLSNEVNWQKAANEFGYSPEVPLEKMIDECLNYFCEQKMLRIKK